ncbi:3-ketoacyl-ACP reductase [Streptomyces albospinus]|uniref:3-ketoacyl-ACP reductase n=1 Tax=Streptomyces albospinus TaxID=285515 RepID=A0ABQ2V1Z9_9ACTN|nr:SDR family oxidoreductase [Streptomyces albospinus]GGU65276.1 3-ketoacyl-ACP reductase [Streptomyces albospinus]
MNWEKDGTALPADGPVALINGGSRGIGYAVAKSLLKRGARVCLTARTPDTLEEAGRRLGCPGRVITVAGRSDDPGHRSAAVTATLQSFGRIDYLVNNAGTNPGVGPLMDVDLGAVTKIFQVNLVSVLGWVQEVWNRWMCRHGGVVLNTASASALRNSVRTGAYNASKYAMVQLTRQLSHELAPGVRVNAIAPSVVRTDFAKIIFDGREEEVTREFPMGRLGTPQDVASLAVFLLGSESSWITGQTIVLDGGITAKAI